MKIKQASSNKKVVLLSLLTLLIILLGVSYYVFAMNGSIFGWKFRPETSSDTNTINYDPPTPEQKKAGEDAKKSTVDSGKPNQSTNLPNTEASAISVSFTSVNQNENALQVRADIQPLIMNGTCTLQLQKGDSIVTKTTPTYPMASISTCQGFDVLTSELSVGTWTVSLSVTAGEKNGKASTSVQIK